MKLVDRRRLVAAASQSNLIDAIAFGVISLNDREGRSVLDHHRITTNERLVSNAAKLMHARIRADARPVLNLDVAAERCGIGHDDAAAEQTVMSDVHLRHQ